MSTQKKSKQIEYVKNEVREGKSSNQIQKDLRARDMGIRRKVLLSTIREIKGIRVHKDNWKYVPTKYRVHYKPHGRRPISENRLSEAEKQIRLGFSQKHISIYGRVDGRSRRIDVYGKGHELYRFMSQASKHPAKTRFFKGSVDKAWMELDYGKTWDEHPDVNS